MLKHDITRCVSLLDLRRVESSTLNTHQEGQKKSNGFKFSLESLSKCIIYCPKRCVNTVCGSGKISEIMFDDYFSKKSLNLSSVMTSPFKGLSSLYPMGIKKTHLGDHAESL